MERYLSLLPHVTISNVRTSSPNGIFFNGVRGPINSKPVFHLLMHRFFSAFCSMVWTFTLLRESRSVFLSTSFDMSWPPMQDATAMCHQKWWLTFSFITASRN